MSPSESLLSGVFSVLATPFRPDRTPDEAGLVAIARYLLAAGADGVVYPSVASENETLTPDERVRLSDLFADEAREHAAFPVGDSSSDLATTETIARHAQARGAAAIMVMAPGTLTDPDAGDAAIVRVVTS